MRPSAESPFLVLLPCMKADPCARMANVLAMAFTGKSIRLGSQNLLQFNRISDVGKMYICRYIHTLCESVL
jgi:hypothetical protein